VPGKQASFDVPGTMVVYRTASFDVPGTTVVYRMFLFKHEQSLGGLA